MDETAMPEERWLPVVRWEGIYEVSDRGRVRSLPRLAHFKDGRKPRQFPGTVMALSTLKSGHKTVDLKALPRLVAAMGNRSCLACFRTHSYFRNVSSPPRTVEAFQVESDRRYAEIIW